MSVLMVCGVGGGMTAALGQIAPLVDHLIVVTDVADAHVERFANDIVFAYPRDLEEVIAATESINHVDGVMSLGYENPPVIAELAVRYGVPGLAPAIAQQCTSKHLRTPALANSGIRVPRHFVLEAMDPITTGNLTLPLIVKPVQLTSSIGISIAETQDEFDEACQFARSVARHKAPIIVEQYLDGSEHTVEGIIVDGHAVVTGFSDRCYTDKRSFGRNVFESGDTLPTALAPSDVAALERISIDAVRALDLDNCCFSNDLMLTRDGPVVIEVACRLAGGRFGTELVPLSTGVNVVPAAVNLALGRPVDLAALASPSSELGVASRFLALPHKRVVRSVDDPFATLCNLPGLYDAAWEQPIEPGHVVAAYRSAKDVVGGVIATAPTAEEAARRSEAYLQLLPISFDE